MSTQITVRLDDADIEYIDRRVATDNASGRAAVIAAGIQALRSQERIETIRASYLLHGEDPATTELAHWSAGQHGIALRYPEDGDLAELEY
jgi:Arc/MetJ-type ribon-helix-helix transcriptional regulator